MGDSFAADGAQAVFRIRCRGTAPVSRIDVLVDGRPLHTFKPSKNRARRNVTVGQRLTLPVGRHACTVRIRQTDRNMAWSSPIWISVPQAAQPR